MCYLLFGSMARQGKRQYIYIDDDDNMDSVCTKLAPLSTAYGMATFKMLAGIGSYASNIKTGRYEVGSSGALMTFRRMRNGMQAPVSITIGSVRTTDKLAHMVSRKLMFSSDELLRLLRDKDVCGKYGYTPDNVIAMFIPNTYDIYWNSSASSFLDRMQRESKRFWTAERREKASTAGLSPLQVMTLASIVSEETANEEEMPSVAGMYINRLGSYRCGAQLPPSRLSVYVCQGGFQRHTQLCLYLRGAQEERCAICQGPERARNKVIKASPLLSNRRGKGAWRVDKSTAIA